MTRVSDRDRRKFAQLETTTCDAVWVTEAGTIELHLHDRSRGRTFRPCCAARPTTARSTWTIFSRFTGSRSSER